VNRLCAEIAGKFGWAFVNVNMRPYYAEGSKSMAYEIAEQLGWRAAAAHHRADGVRLVAHQDPQGLPGICEARPRREFRDHIHGAQATGCSPISTAQKAGLDFFKPVKPDTIAKSLAIGTPADGFYALKVMRETNAAPRT
jgi:threonine synthase